MRNISRVPWLQVTGDPATTGRARHPVLSYLTRRLKVGGFRGGVTAQALLFSVLSMSVLCPELVTSSAPGQGTLFPS